MFYSLDQNHFTLCFWKLINCFTFAYAVVTTLVNFMTMFRRVHSENCKLTEFERKKAEKETQRERMKVSPLKKESCRYMISLIAPFALIWVLWVITAKGSTNLIMYFISLILLDCTHSKVMPIFHFNLVVCLYNITAAAKPINM